MNQFSVMDHVSNWLMRPRLGDDKPPSFWPSSAAALGSDNVVYGTCRRKIFLQYLKTVVQYSQKSDGRYDFWNSILEELKESSTSESKYMHWIWEQGNLFEDHVLDLVKESGLFVATQVQVYIPEYNVSGKIDCIAFNALTSKNIITEIKSVYGMNGDKTIGTEWERTHNQSGTPRDYNLMQLAIYQYHYADDSFDYGQLIYGDRGTGRYATYQVDVNKTTGAIRYRSIDPNFLEWVTVPYTIFDVLNNYKYLQQSIDAGSIPDRDFQLVYDDATMIKMINESFTISTLDKDDDIIEKYLSLEDFIAAGKDSKIRKFLLTPKGKTTITKTVSEQFVKWLDRKTNQNKEIKKPVEGSFHCAYCNYSGFCFNADGTPKK